MAPTPDPQMDDLLYLQVLTLATQLQSAALAKGRTASFTTHIEEAAELLKKHRTDIAQALRK